MPRFWQHVRSRAGIRVHCLEPAALGVRSIGHFGFFRRYLQSTFWPQVAVELERMLKGL